MRKLRPIQYEILRELYKAVESLNAPMELLSTIGSWGDTLEEDEILELLEDYNERKRRGERMTESIKSVEARRN